MKHLNGDILCAIDTETTGLDPLNNEIWDLCILPIDDKLNIHKGFKPFQAMMKPERPELFERNQTMRGITKSEIVNQGHDKYKVLDFFEDWFKKLNLPQGKKIVPLAHNWPFDREFLIEWMGRKTFGHYFSGFYRDTMQLALFQNDRNWFKEEPYNYARVSLGALASRMDLEIMGLHRATEDCITTLAVYKKLLKDSLY